MLLKYKNETGTSVAANKKLNTEQSRLGDRGV